ncbi:DarT ssDNA thymidine ADP-ribosyltransferase family protein [Robertkochia sediminum]|uniref:DarT ssDNA thymidine ADP-ribosyltransferase family protein n=1 Tax=Robertkochia sediminum TaxID=2785326 RepID=UPI0019334B4F|nr:DarT ssDNA thymidine ADP-ribosyltransferase family protein [Robertkochia sediminum]MBL7471384.1 DUF4433 domain-containing protein [Robertkochia sediminum]
MGFFDKLVSTLKEWIGVEQTYDEDISSPAPIIITPSPAYITLKKELHRLEKEIEHPVSRPFTHTEKIILERALRPFSLPKQSGRPDEITSVAITLQERKRELSGQRDKNYQRLEQEVFGALTQIKETRKIEEERKRKLALKRKVNARIAKITKLIEQNDFALALTNIDELTDWVPERKGEFQALKKGVLKQQEDFKRDLNRYITLWNSFKEYKKANNWEAARNAALEVKKIASYTSRGAAMLQEVEERIRQKKLLEEKLRKAAEEQRRLREKYKEDAEQIRSLLKEKGIHKFYHFTDAANLNSIIQNGGLFSWKYIEEKGVPIVRFGGDQSSRNNDVKYGLEDYVRLAFNDQHPMSYFAKKEGRIGKIEWLEIDTEVATLKPTLFSDMNATKNGHQTGGDYHFLKNNIRFEIVKQPNQWDPVTQEKSPYYQAEVMVKQHLPLQYITNLD